MNERFWNEKVLPLQRKLRSKLKSLDEPPKPLQSRTYYVHKDHLGTPRELTNSVGEIVWAASYKAWGATASIEHSPTQQTVQVGNTVQMQWVQPLPEEAPEQNLRFQGQYFDEETGLHYNRFRYYDPDCGRFISHDPIRLWGGDNFYYYAPNPTKWVDPWGLKSFSHLDTNGGSGFNIYAICSGKGVVGYVGQTNDVETRTQGHLDSGRLQPGQTLKTMTTVPTYGDARGYEQALIDHHDTLGQAKKGKWNCKCGPGNIGNKKVGYDRNSTSRPEARQNAFEEGYKKAQDWIKANPGKVNPC